MTIQRSLGKKEMQVVPFHFWPAVLFVCLISRLITTIYYIEDVDSLRFAESVLDYSLVQERPHFPGYPVYCLLVRLLYWLVGSIAIAFSVVGALANFVVVYFTAKISQKCFSGTNLTLVVALCVVNPLFWLMSNRYMPDLMGLAVALAALYWLIFGELTNKKNALIAGVMTGILCGVRLSYAPLLAVPLITCLLKSELKKLSLIVGVIFGIVIWLIPLIIDTGWSSLLEVATRQTNGHFYEFGGTVFNENDLMQRLWRMLQYTWGDGLGGWLPGRYWITMVLGGIMVYLISRGVFVLFQSKLKGHHYLMIASFVIYFLWILFFQNVLYKSRHLLPILPFIVLVLALAIQKHGHLMSLAFGLLLVLLQLSVTGVLVVQHKTPTALVQATKFLENVDPGKEIVIDALPIQQRYLRSQLLRPFRFRKENEHIASPRGRTRVYSFVPYVSKQPKAVKQFFHNPYVNRMWSEMRIYIYEQ